jgi:TPR repeat protein
MIRWLFSALIVSSICLPARADFGAAERAYANGDIEGALQEYEKRAAEGSGEALFTLGVIYARGVDVPRDLIASYKWMCLAASKGTEDAARRAQILTRPLSHTEIRKAEELAAQWLDENPQGSPFKSCYQPS